MSNQTSQNSLSTPTSLAVSGGAVAQTVDPVGLPTSDVAGQPGETLPNSIGLLLIALIGMVAVSRRGVRKVRKDQ